METEGIPAEPISVCTKEDVHTSTDNGEKSNPNNGLSDSSQVDVKQDNGLSDLSQVDVSGCFTGLRAKTLEELYDLYRKHSYAVGFVVRSTTQRSDRDGFVIEKYYVCSCQGYKNGKKEVPAASSLDTFNAQTNSPKTRRRVKNCLKTRTGCKAGIRIKFIRGAYEVKSHLTSHNHELTRTEWQWQYLQRSDRKMTEEEAKSIEGFSIGNMLKESSYFDTIETDDEGHDNESNIPPETPLKRKGMNPGNEVSKRPKNFEQSDMDDAHSPMNLEGKSEDDLKKLVDCGSTMARNYFNAAQSLVAMKDEQLQKQAALANEESLRKRCMEEKVRALETRVEQLEAEREYIYSGGFKDVCSKLLVSAEFGERICDALYAGRECVASKNSKDSHDALMRSLDLVQNGKYDLLDAIHPGMSFEALKAWSSETGNQSSLSTRPVFHEG